jgi:hypothetical protein
MNKQITFTDAEYAQRKLTGGWEKFLDTMDAIVPWAAFEEKIAPFYSKSGRLRQRRNLSTRATPPVRIWLLEVSICYGRAVGATPQMLSIFGGFRHAF